MDSIFVLLTQLNNQTEFPIDFAVKDHDRRLLPELPPGKTRFAEPSWITQRAKNYEPGWKFRVMLDGKFTGIELDPLVIVNRVRVAFRVVGNVLFVDGVEEKPGGCSSIDALYRLRFFGFMRDSNWNGRTSQVIERSDTESATELRNKEGHCQHLAPFVDPESISSTTPAPSNDSPSAALLSPSMPSSGRDIMHGSGRAMSSFSYSGGIATSTSDMSSASSEADVESSTGEMGGLPENGWLAYDNTNQAKEMGVPINDVQTTYKVEDSIDKMSRYLEAEVRERAEIWRKLHSGTSAQEIDITYIYLAVINRKLLEIEGATTANEEEERKREGGQRS